ncbi:hypothetical protein [Aliarcobacter butzleri]|uniref:hypothetical protein n=1 Tax=Aliarcobacter butzleri TaxID=28197 RepID=UPI0012F957D5|nr:hypothetical protein [Aliarcobacter butzleri]
MNIPLLININGIYWDDWTLYNHSFEAIHSQFSQNSGNAGIIWSSMHYFLINYFGVVSYRVLTFGLLFLSGWFVFKILSNTSLFSKKDAFYLTIFFLLAPLYVSKVALINFWTTIASFIFYFSFYLLSKWYDKELNIFKRVVVLSLFFISFFINSILVFYAIVLIYIFYVEYSLDKSILKNTVSFIKKNTDFILLPIAFYIVKSIYFVPFGLYESYNNINIYNILNLDFYYLVFINNFIEPIKFSIPNIFFYIIILSLSLSILFFRQNNQVSKKNIYFLLLGIIIFYLGAFAYISVNKIPANYNWSSRFQVLLPLGFSFILYYGIQIISNLLNLKSSVRYFLYLIFIIFFSFFHLKEQCEHNVDWLYQQSIIENFKNTIFIQENDTFEVTVNLDTKLAQKRLLGFYELNGLSREAFHKDNKFFFGYYQKKILESYDKIINYKQYNFSSWKKNYTVRIEINDNLNNQFNKSWKDYWIYLLKLKYLEITDIDKFKKEVKNLVIIELKK